MFVNLAGDDEFSFAGQPVLEGLAMIPDHKVGEVGIELFAVEHFHLDFLHRQRQHFALDLDLYTALHPRLCIPDKLIQERTSNFVATAPDFALAGRKSFKFLGNTVQYSDRFISILMIPQYVEHVVGVVDTADVIDVVYTKCHCYREQTYKYPLYLLEVQI